MTIYLTDGLGNQMFQYAFARQLSLRKKATLNINNEFFSLIHASDTKRDFALSKMNIPNYIKVESGKKSKIKGLFFGKFILPIYRRTYDISKRYYGKFFIIANNRNVHDFDTFSIKRLSKNCHIYGQFQSPRWFEEYSEVIKKELKVIVEQKEENVKLSQKIKASNSVCVHIRRGDYLHAEWNHLNICSYDYFYKAMSIIKDKIDNPLFFIFSNSHEDIEWIKENYDFSEFDVVYVDENNPDYEELHLMYTCKHFIISNSTYSWWAQYLCENDDKIVVSPSKWSKFDKVQSPLLLPEFKLIDVEYN